MPLGQQRVDEMGADEASPAGNQVFRTMIHAPSLRFGWWVSVPMAWLGHITAPTFSYAVGSRN
ncbi:hypothetical protein [Streptomyces sp. DG1A-41]|uniref:hypothetical protein n=1 Tax=Streptomyces sp. DG1A-41 TaxID=3125779 RepID=UPI0030CD3FE1